MEMECVVMDRSGNDRSALIAEYGAPGEPVPGSLYYRQYCARCGDPIRVGASNAESPSCLCHACSPAVDRSELAYRPTDLMLFEDGIMQGPSVSASCNVWFED